MPVPRMRKGWRFVEVEALAALLRPFSAPADSRLFLSGAPAERVFLLASGELELDQPVADRVGPGVVLGELALNGPSAHSATATTVGPVTGFYLEVGDFDQLRAAVDPLACSVLRRLARLLADRVRNADGDVARSQDDPGPAARSGPAPALGVLAELPHFRACAPDELGGLMPSLRTWQLDAEARLFGEGNEARSAFIVLQGAVEVSRQHGDRHVRLATIGPGRMLGELSLLDGGGRTATCHAVEDTIVSGARCRARRRLHRDALHGRARVPAGDEPIVDRRSARVRRAADGRDRGGAEGHGYRREKLVGGWRQSVIARARAACGSSA